MLAWFRRPSFNVAEAVIRLRRFRGLSQAQLAEKMGTHQPAVARIERGEANLRLSSLEQIAVALNATVRIELAPAELLAATVRKRAWWEDPDAWLLLGSTQSVAQFEVTTSEERVLRTHRHVVIQTLKARGWGEACSETVVALPPAPAARAPERMSAGNSD